MTSVPTIAVVLALSFGTANAVTGRTAGDCYWTGWYSNDEGWNPNDNTDAGSWGKPLTAASCDDWNCGSQNLYLCDKFDGKKVNVDLGNCYDTGAFSNNDRGDNLPLARACKDGFAIANIGCFGKGCDKPRLQCCELVSRTHDIVMTEGYSTVAFRNEDGERDGICDAGDVAYGMKCDDDYDNCGKHYLYCSRMTITPKIVPITSNWNMVCSYSQGSTCTSSFSETIKRKTGSTWTHSDTESVTNSMSVGVSVPNGAVSSTFGHSETNSVYDAVTNMMENERDITKTCEIGSSKVNETCCPNPTVWQFTVLSDDFTISPCFFWTTCSASIQPKCMPGCCANAECYLCNYGGACPERGAPDLPAPQSLCKTETLTLK